MNDIRNQIRGVAGILGALSVVGCLGRSATVMADRPLAPTSLAVVTVSPRASILAVGGTQQLTVTAVDFRGGAVTAFDSVVYQLVSPADSVRVRLSSTGLMTGLASTARPVQVFAFAFQGSSFRGEQALAQVTATAASGLVLSIQPVGLDSAKLAAGATKTIVPVLRNPITGTTVTNPVVWYQRGGADSLHVDVYRPTVYYLDPITGSMAVTITATSFSPASSAPASGNQIVALSGEGAAWLFATINAYGTVVQDSVRYTFSYPYTATLSTVKTNLEVTNIFSGQTLTLAPGATVSFQNGVAATDPLTMAYTFDTPVAATVASPAGTFGGPSGNVTTLIGGQSSARKFLTVGTYHWTATAAGGPAPWSGQTVSGTLVIK